MDIWFRLHLMAGVGLIMLMRGCQEMPLYQHPGGYSSTYHRALEAEEIAGPERLSSSDPMTDPTRDEVQNTASGRGVFYPLDSATDYANDQPVPRTATAIPEDPSLGLPRRRF